MLGFKVIWPLLPLILKIFQLFEILHIKFRHLVQTLKAFEFYQMGDQYLISLRLCSANIQTARNAGLVFLYLRSWKI